MIDVLEKFMDPGRFVEVLVILFLAAYFIYKEWPEFVRRISSDAVKNQRDELTGKTVGARLDSIEHDVEEINQKLDRDYQRLNRMEVQLERTKAVQASMHEELEIIMEALLGALGGLQELGANGQTLVAKDRIQNYLNKRAHRPDPKNI